MVFKGYNIIAFSVSIISDGNFFLVIINMKIHILWLCKNCSSLLESLKCFVVYVLYITHVVILLVFLSVLSMMRENV